MLWAAKLRGPRSRPARPPFEARRSRFRPDLHCDGCRPHPQANNPAKSRNEHLPVGGNLRNEELELLCGRFNASIQHPQPGMTNAFQRASALSNLPRAQYRSSPNLRVVGTLERAVLPVSTIEGCRRDRAPSEADRRNGQKDSEKGHHCLPLPSSYRAAVIAAVTNLSFVFLAKVSQPG